MHFGRRPFAYSGMLARSFSHSVRSVPQLCTTQEHGSSDSSSCQPKFALHLQAIPGEETPEVLKHKCFPLVRKPTSPRRECTSSSTALRSRKLILRSVPPFTPFSPAPWKFFPEELACISYHFLHDCRCSPPNWILRHFLPLCLCSACLQF